MCHSLGGLIGKRYLIDQVEQSKTLRVKGLVLYAVPNNGAGLASVGNFISWRHGQLRQLCRQSDLVRTISTSWHRQQMAERLHVSYVVAGLDTVVDEFSARDSWGNVAVDVVADCDHRSIVKPMLSSDLAYTILRNKLLKPGELLKTEFARSKGRYQGPSNVRLPVSAVARNPGVHVSADQDCSWRQVCSDSKSASAGEFCTEGGCISFSVRHGFNWIRSISGPRSPTMKWLPTSEDFCRLATSRAS